MRATEEEPDLYSSLARALTDHSVPTTREEAKSLIHAANYGAVLPARQTFVVEKWRTRTSNVASTWDYSGKPSSKGWYAVLVCWDAEEGAFPRAGYWNGVAWVTADPVTAYYTDICSSETEATDLAYRNDPDKA